MLLSCVTRSGADQTSSGTHEMARLALALVVLAVELIPNDGFGFNVGPSTPAVRRLSHRRAEKRGVDLNVETTSLPEESARSSQSGLLRRDALPASKRRRVKGAIKRRARRLARLRNQNKARQDALVLPSQVVGDERIATSTYFPMRRRAAAAAPAEAEAPVVPAPAGQKSTGKFAAEIRVKTTGDAAILAETASETAGAAAAATAPTAKQRKRKHATIKGRPIVKGGKERGLWRSIFGLKPLLEVYSIDQLTHLVDVEGWRLEDLSVLTGGGSDSARQTQSATADAADIIATASAADVEGAMQATTAAAAAAFDGAETLDSKTFDLKASVQGAGPVTATCIGDEEGDASDGDDDATLDVDNTALPPPEQERLHPAVQAVLERAAAGTTPSSHLDGRRIGLAIEGGGMRGCVAAGMASCLHFLGLADSFDCVYGASAGSLIGAYFVSRQWNGTAVYHDILPCAGARFIDMTKFPQALGFELPKVPKKGAGGEELSALKAAHAASFARVIGLDFLLEDVVGRVHALDFEAFSSNDRVQPLHVVASGVSSMKTVSLASRRGHFSTLNELKGCLRASMLVPGLAGPLLSVPQQRGQQARDGAISASRGVRVQEESRPGKVDVEAAAAPAVAKTSESSISDKAGTGGGDELTELLVDALVFEPLPYRSAIEDGCTDVVVLCTRPEGSQVLGKKPSIYETRVVKKFFDQHDDLATTAGISEYVQQLQHLRIYAEDALVLSEGSRTGLPQEAPKGGPGEGREAFVLAIAPDASTKEVSQLEMDREVILQGCRDGFAACYDTFVGAAKSLAVGEGELSLGDEPTAGQLEEGREDEGGAAGLVPRSGAEVALEYFPDSLLSAPVDLNATYYEKGRFISDRSQQNIAPHFAPPAEGGGARITGHLAVTGNPHARVSGEGGGGGELERLLQGHNGDGGAAAAFAASAAAAVVEGAGQAPVATSKFSPSNGARGLLRRLLSRGKLRRSLRGNASRAAAATPAAPNVSPGEGYKLGDESCEGITAVADPTL